MRKSYFFTLVLCTMFVFDFSAFAKDSDKIPIKIDKSTNRSYITSITDPGWSYSCKDGIEVDLVSSGLKNNIPMTLPIDDVGSIDRIVVEIVYKGSNPGASIEVEDDQGATYAANREVPSGGSSNVWYYRTELPATTSISYANTTNESKAQSILAYVFRNKNTGIASSGVFTALSGYNNVETITIPIITDTAPRDVKIELPVSELTPDGRYIKITAETSDGKIDELIENINDFPSGECCIKVFNLGLTDVAGDVDEVTITIDTRNNQNGQSVNGQSWVMGGAVKTNVVCTCVDFDTEPPTPDNLNDHIIVMDINNLPEVTFSDNCSDVTVSYNQYLAEESCWIDFGPVYTESNIWFHSFPFDQWHHWEEGYFQKFEDGTAKVHGRVVNNTDPASGWIVEIFFEQLVDFTTWQAAGGYIEGDDQKELRSYANVDFGIPYTLEGFGDYAGSNLTLLNNTDFHHMDIGPRDVYGDYGIGFWISYEGTVNGQAVGGDDKQHIDMYASLENCVNRRSILLVREWTVTDAAGNTAVYIQRVEAEE